MFKSIGTTLLTGLITLLPVVLTIYLLYWLAVSAEQILGGALQWTIPGAIYFPGLGTIVGLAIVFLVGLMMKAIFVRQIFAFGKQIIYKLPLVNTIYRVMHDLFDFFSPKKKGFGQVVIVNIDGMEMIGFITQEDSSRLPEAFQKPETALVYIPMSYMIGGFTLLVPLDKMSSCKMSMDEAMRFVLTAGITGKKT
ncbi:MAG: putative membrane protein [Urechidicola sp.]|jgi:uncharacterized membrane protein